MYLSLFLLCSPLQASDEVKTQMYIWLAAGLLACWEDQLAIPLVVEIDDVCVPGAAKAIGFVCFR